MSSKLRIAIIGCGSIGGFVHLRNLKKNKEADIVALIDNSEKRLKEAHLLASTAEIHTSSEEFFKKGKSEAVIISTPPDSHCELAKSALSAGMSVYLEKPLGVNKTEGEALVALARSINATTMLGFNYRFNPVFIELRKAIEENIVGEIQCVRTIFTITEEHAKYDMRRKRPLNTVLSDLGSHHFDLLKHIFHLPVTSISNGNPAGKNHLVTASLNMLIADRIPVQSYFNLGGALENRVEVFGSEGTLVADRYRSLYLERQSKHRRIWDFISELRKIIYLPLHIPRYINYCLSTWGDPSYRIALDKFIHAAKERIPIKPDFEDGLYALRMVDAAEDAIRGNLTVKFNP
jgi:predicted dehydrogenase